MAEPPKKKSAGRIPKPDYGPLPFAAKIALANLGANFLHGGLPHVAARYGGYKDRIPRSIRDKDWSDLDSMDRAEARKFLDLEDWFFGLDDPEPQEPKYPADFQTLKAYRHLLLERGRFPTIPELVEDQKKHIQGKDRVADPGKQLKTILKKEMRLPFITDSDLAKFRRGILKDPKTVDDEAALQNLLGKCPGIYRPVKFWPPDLLCVLLFEHFATKREVESVSVNRYSLPVLLEEIRTAAFEMVSRRAKSLARDWRSLAAEERIECRIGFQELGEKIAARALPWFAEAEQLCDFTYDEGSGILPLLISDAAAKWGTECADRSIIDHLGLPELRRICSELETENFRLFQASVRSLAE